MTPAPIRVDALPDGGFVVSELPTGPNMASPALFACTEIDDALGYIKDKLEQGKSQLVHVEDEPGQMSAPGQPLDALAARRRAFLDGDGECRPLNEAFAR